MTGVIVACSLSRCVHVWGVHHFLGIAREMGFRTHFAGPALTAEEVVAAAREHGADCVAVSYRLTPETGRNALVELIAAVGKDLDEGLQRRRFVFAGTTPVAECARELAFFDEVFDGSTTREDVVAYLTRTEKRITEREVASLRDLDMVGRHAHQRPFPLLRHHYGRPTVEETAAGIGKIAESGVLDVICIGTDQDAQESFFHPQQQSPSQLGAGGVPVRCEDDFRKLYEASRTGNHPLLRTYCGTRDLIPLAELHQRTIRLCSAGIPVFWYNQMDGRGPMTLVDSIRAHREAIAWHAERGVPVEILDPHQWGMRGSHDVTFVVSAFLGASLCKALGVHHYIAQLMFNTPRELSFRMDLAKILAVLDLILPLQDADFSIYKMPRTGLLSFPPDEDEAKGQLAASTMMQMAVEPDLINVVGYCEANRAVTHQEVIESCKIVRRVVENALLNAYPDMTRDPDVEARRRHLVGEASVLISALHELAASAGRDWLSPESLAAAVSIGLLDSPQLQPGRYARAEMVTAVVGGAVEAVDPGTRRVLGEAERIARLMPGGLAVQGPEAAA